MSPAPKRPATLLMQGESRATCLIAFSARGVFAGVADERRDDVDANAEQKRRVSYSLPDARSRRGVDMTLNGNEFLTRRATATLATQYWKCPIVFAIGCE